MNFNPIRCSSQRSLGRRKSEKKIRVIKRQQDDNIVTFSWCIEKLFIYLQEEKSLGVLKNSYFINLK